jgi:hypothetical protein
MLEVQKQPEQQASRGEESPRLIQDWRVEIRGGAEYGRVGVLAFVGLLV